MTTTTQLNNLSTSSFEYINEAVEGLKTTNVYANTVSPLSHSAELAITYKNDQVAIASLPYAAIDTVNATTLAENILAKTQGYTTVIVVVDGKTFGVASTKENAPEIQKGLFENYQTDAGSTLLLNHNLVVMKTTNTTTVKSSIPAPPILLTPLFVGMEVIILIAFVFWLYNKPTIHTWISKIIFEAKHLIQRGPLNKTFIKTLPPTTQDAFNSLQKLRLRYFLSEDEFLVKNIQILLIHTQTLLMRGSTQSNASIYNLMLEKYTHNLQKFNIILGDKYLLDIKEYPDYWPNPTKLRHQVETLLRDYNTELLLNIQQLNTGQDVTITLISAEEFPLDKRQNESPSSASSIQDSVLPQQ